MSDGTSRCCAQTVPRATVIVLTYNHESFIRQALESVCRQETDFPFQVVVIDDCSADRTPEIIEELRHEYPGRISLIRPPQNKNSQEDFAKAVNDCESRYIALLDGDDYWTSSEKLAKQVAYLDAHPELTICCNKVLVKYEDGRKDEIRYGIHRPFLERDDLWQGCPIHWGSVTFRRSSFERLPDWYYGSQFGDWELFIFLTGFGNIGCLDEVLSIYRVHGGGIWSGDGPRERAQRSLRFLAHMEESLGSEFRPTAAAAQLQDYLRGVLYVQSGDLATAKGYLWRTVKQYRIGGRLRARKVAWLLFRFTRALLLGASARSTNRAGSHHG